MKPPLARSLARLTLFVASSALLASVSAAPLSFQITDLGAGTASAINDLGQVVGRSAGGAPFVWSSKTGTVGLARCTVGCFDDVVPLDINNRGQIVGQGTDPGLGQSRALRWDGANNLVILPRVFGNFTGASAINKSGLAVGVTGGGHSSFPMYWDKDAHGDPGGDLGHGGFLLPGPLGAAYDVNDAGVIVGTFAKEDGVSGHAALWRGGSVQDLGTLAGEISSAALGINNKDVVVGNSGFGGSFVRAILWTAASGIVDINPVGEHVSTARAINDNNWVVGSFGPRLYGSSGDRAALWRPNAEVDDLNSLVDLSHSTFSHLTAAVDINAVGDIVGTGRGRDGLVHAFLLTPVPEMQTWGCVLVGVVLIACLAKRTNRQSTSGSI